MVDGETGAQHEVEAALADELLRLHCESYGEGASTSRVHILDDLVVCLLDDLTLLPNERFMIEAGKGEAVLELRSRYQHAIEATFRAAVERATGRTVISFASHTLLDPDHSLEIFRLAPPSDDVLGSIDG